MPKVRTIQIVGGKVSFEDAEENDFNYWLTMNWKERMQQLLELKKSIWIKLNGSYPTEIEKVGGKVYIDQNDEDDF